MQYIKFLGALSAYSEKTESYVIYETERMRSEKGRIRLYSICIGIFWIGASVIIYLLGTGVCLLDTLHIAGNLYNIHIKYNYT